MLTQLFNQDHAKGWRSSVANTDWKSFAETLIRGLHDRGEQTMILVDELALFVAALLKKNPQAAREFLYGLRALQQSYPNVRWLFTGSIGLDTVARRGDLAGALVDLQSYPLGPLSREAARAYIDHLAATGKVMHPFCLDDAAFAAFAEGLGWLAPYYVEQVALLMRPTGALNAGGLRTASEANVAAAFDAILRPEYRTYFVTWEEHLSNNFKPAEAASMRRVLDVCARQPAGEQPDTIFARLGGPLTGPKRKALKDQLNTLAADGFLEAVGEGDSERFRFRSGLLRRYWQRYMGE